jgi:hypothetical protein
MQSHTVRRITSAHAALSRHALTTRHITTRPSSLCLVGPSVRGTLVSRYVLSLHQIQRLTNGSLTQTFPNPASTTSPERSEAMRPSRPCLHLLCSRLALLRSLMILPCLAGCEPASPNNAPVLESHASVGGKTASQRLGALGEKGDRKR